MNKGDPITAAILVKSREDLVVDDIKLPEVLAPGQVLVRILYSGVCGSQLGEIDAVKGPDRWLPHLLGHEASGEVIEPGPGVRTVSAGDRVVLHWRSGEGISAEPPEYRWGRKVVNAGQITTFSQAAVVSENRMTKVPDKTNMKVAPLFGCAVTTGFGVVTNDASLTIGESVVVFGAGGVGLSIIQAAGMVSAHPVIAVDRYDNRLRLARSLGATHAINGDKVDAQGRITRILKECDLDVFVDNTGDPRVIELGYKMTGPKGRVILVGVPRVGKDAMIHTLPLHFGKKIAGSEGGQTEPERDVPRYLRLYEAGHLNLDQLLRKKPYPLERINDALRDMRDGSVAGRCLIEM